MCIRDSLHVYQNPGGEKNHIIMIENLPEILSKSILFNCVIYTRRFCRPTQKSTSNQNLWTVERFWRQFQNLAPMQRLQKMTSEFFNRSHVMVWRRILCRPRKSACVNHPLHIPILSADTVIDVRSILVDGWKILTSFFEDAALELDFENDVRIFQPSTGFGLTSIFVSADKIGVCKSHFILLYRIN